MVAPFQRIASAFCVWFGRHGDVARHAHERGVLRQTLYRESAQAVAAVDGEAQRTELDRCRARLAELEQQVAVLRAARCGRRR